MSSSTTPRFTSSLTLSRADLQLVLPIFVGLLSIYGPIYVQLNQTLWQDEEAAHAPLIAMVVAYLFWRIRGSLNALPRAPIGFLGGGLTLLGILIVLAGSRVQSPFLQMLSQPILLTGLVVLFRGRAGLALAWVPLLYLLFMVPLPGVVIDTITWQLKLWVSQASEMILYGLGYPIARSGVLISIGSYQLLVADACSGLHSIVSLSALISLLVYLRPAASKLQNLVMLCCIFPIAFLSNLFRVLLLVLVTYYLGDRTAHTIHDVAGYLVFIAALVLFFGFDAALCRLFRISPKTKDPL